MRELERGGGRPYGKDWHDLENTALISLSEAAAISGLSMKHLGLLARRGDLQARKIGRNWVTTRAAVEDYLRDVAKRRNDPYKRKR